MDEERELPPALTRRAIQAWRAGEAAEARRLLADALTQHPRYSPAWLWFAAVTVHDGERRFCLERALSADEDATARIALNRVRRHEPSIPPEVEHIIDPPPPGAELVPAARDRQAHRALRRISLGLVAVIVLSVVIAVALMGGRRAPVRIAFVAGMTGVGAGAAKEMQHGAQLYVDEINKTGGVRGHQVELVVYDDKDDPQLARQRATEIVNDHRILGVIGHRTSSASIAAGSIYARAGVPAITPTSTADEVTKDDPWYFRMVFTNSAEGNFIGTYLHAVLGVQRVSIIEGTDTYGRSLAQGLRAVLPDQDKTLVAVLDTSAAPGARAIDDVVSRIKTESTPGVIVLALPDFAAKVVVSALRVAGIQDTMFGGDALASDTFFQALSALPEDRAHPGVLTDNLFATAPLIDDALTGDAVRWKLAFTSAYHEIPSWRAATAYDSAVTLVNALGSKGVDLQPRAYALARRALRDSVASHNSPDKSLHGVVAPIWFDSTQSSVVPISVGHAHANHFVSAFDQLQPTGIQKTPTSDEAAKAGLVVGPTGTVYQRKRIVTVGITVNNISNLDQQAQTFFADFFVWLKFTGSDDVTQLMFANAVDPTTALGDPVRASTADGVSYRLYRAFGTFKTALSFREFPFDRQTLPLEVQNRALPSSSVIYAVDAEVFDAPQRVLLTSGANAAEPILAVPNWLAVHMVNSQSTVGAATPLGDPALRAGQAGLSYSRFITEVTIRRDVRSFLIKNLLPLLLLVGVTYASLFFSHSETPGIGVGFATTGILVGAVLLDSVTSSLPNVGYTVAIQWGYYSFILLAGGCVLATMIGDRLQQKGDTISLQRLDVLHRVSRLAYPAGVVFTVLAYVILYR